MREEIQEEGAYLLKIQRGRTDSTEDKLVQY